MWGGVVWCDVMWYLVVPLAVVQEMQHNAVIWLISSPHHHTCTKWPCKRIRHYNRSLHWHNGHWVSLGTLPDYKS